MKLSYEYTQALKRPSNYDDLSSREQWAIDKRLNILDWDPTDREVSEYLKARKKKL